MALIHTCTDVCKWTMRPGVALLCGIARESNRLKERPMPPAQKVSGPGVPGPEQYGRRLTRRS